ncbi:hypothetical protein, partial [Paenibacillus sp. GbtcB18]|uniref:hypothetical protein n=1 Tax=Paenibacillus sp. GbtcB18 TaxID=2824763 RepID=UPI001C30B193
FDGKVPAILLPVCDLSATDIFQTYLASYDDFPDLVCGQLVSFGKNNSVLFKIYAVPLGLYCAVSRC